MSKDFRVEVRVKNARLYNAITDLGYKSCAAFCRDMNLSSTVVSEYVSMRRTPLNLMGDRATLDNNPPMWKDSAIEIATCLGLSPEDLWPEQLQIKLERNTACIDMDAPQVARIMNNSKTTIEHELDEKIDMIDAIQRYVGRLSDREREVIEKRYGLNGIGEHTLAEIADEQQVGRERIRQIEVKAIRKIKRYLNVD
jgi:RNA polymerase sigma factor (sigma-70 family)